MKTGSWREHPLWLRSFPEPVPEDVRSPYDVALCEAEFFMRTNGDGVQIAVEPVPGRKAGGSGVAWKAGETEKDQPWSDDAFEICCTGPAKKDYLVRGGKTGVLYGVYALIGNLILDQPVCSGWQLPRLSLRMLESWDNMDGSVERGYAGRSIWFEKDAFCYESQRIRQLGRLLASAGINVLCINNVNVHAPAQQLIGELLEQTAAFADLLRPFGVRLMVSIDFSMPVSDGLATADPLDKDVAAWWKKRADEIYRLIPDFAGFLVKADSEHRPGPNTYGRTHAQGANMLAEALAPWGGVVVWRAFVYNCMQDWRDVQTDRPCAAYEAYRPLDGAFAENVILQVKFGPCDFQVREPVSPLLLGMEKTQTAVELQLAQEYTGQQIDLFAMPSMWHEIFGQIGRERIGRMQALAAVSNLGRDANWTGHPFAALNLYAFGRYAWDPAADPRTVMRDWVALTFNLEETHRRGILDVLLMSRPAYEKYTSQLGLGWMLHPADHYGPDPWGYEFSVWGTYNRADRMAVGIDRTESGTGLTAQYPEDTAKLYADPAACPDELLLFFHRLPYTWRMRDGRTLIQRLYDDHFEGYELVLQMRDKLQGIPLPENDRQVVRERMQRQLKNAREWRDVTNTFFCRLSGIPDEKGRKIYAV